MIELSAQFVAEMVGKGLRGEMPLKDISEWAWDRHWRYERGEEHFEAGKEDVLFEVIVALASGAAEGCILTDKVLRDMLKKLQ